MPATWDDLWNKIRANGYKGITYKYREANICINLSKQES